MHLQSFSFSSLTLPHSLTHSLTQSLTVSGETGRRALASEAVHARARLLTSRTKDTLLDVKRPSRGDEVCCLRRGSRAAVSDGSAAASPDRKGQRETERKHGSSSSRTSVISNRETAALAVHVSGLHRSRDTHVDREESGCPGGETKGTHQPFVGLGCQRLWKAIHDYLSHISPSLSLLPLVDSKIPRIKERHRRQTNSRRITGDLESSAKSSPTSRTVPPCYPTTCKPERSFVSWPSDWRSPCSQSRVRQPTHSQRRTSASSLSIISPTRTAR